MSLWKATFLLCLLAVFAAASTGCQRPPRATVKDYDTYQLVNLGEVRYTTPEGLRVETRGRGYAVHTVDAHPEIRLRIEVDPNPPRSLRVDAESQQRRFLRDLGIMASTSVQYSSRHDREIVKYITRGRSGDPDSPYGSLMLIRKEGATAVLKVTGPLRLRTEMNTLIERMGRHIEFSRLDLM